MSGADILYWLNGIWYDVTHLATADIPSLLFRLFVLLLAIVIGQELIRIVLHILWDIVRPVAQLIRGILYGLWWVVSAPVRIPRDWLRHYHRAKADRQRARDWERQRQQQAAAEQEKTAAQERERRAEYERMKRAMNRLE